MKIEEIQPGAVVKFYRSVGYITDVCYSQTTPNIVVSIRSISDIFQGDRGRILPLGPQDYDILEPATREDVLKEIGLGAEMTNHRLLEFLDYSIPSDGGSLFSLEEIVTLTGGRLTPTPDTVE